MDVELDLPEIATALESALPSLGSLGRVSPLGRGFRSEAVETSSGLVFKIGILPDATADYERERRVGSFLASRTSVRMPVPRWYIEPNADLPYGALGYEKLAGSTPEWGANPDAAFARDLGQFMAELHQISVHDAVAAGLPEVDSYQRLLGARDVVMPVLAREVPSAAFTKIQAWWDGLAADARMTESRDAVCHHDLWHGNLLQSSDGRLSGVLDIAHVEVGDPAQDFAAPRYFGTAFMAELLDAYRTGGGSLADDDLHRAERFHQGREFGGLAWAIEHDDQQEVDESIQKVLEGPVVSGDPYGRLDS